ncbi:hypothetical protein [Peterkaempfera sp. SMS 1(5)a]|uniref:hypothetical protein n=1 Tax=Peterkaempfera podocarpi TaxID=3232308 RepID=UPI0036732A9D
MRSPWPERRRIVVLVLAAALLPVAGPSVAGGQPPILLDDLSQMPAARPVTFTVTSTVALSGLRWSNWGAPTATARGSLGINTCRPDCAQGRVRVLPGAELQVQGVRIDQGLRYYGQYRILDQAFSPEDRAQYSRWTKAYVPSDFR